ncbi:hypothetical protein RJ639_015751 [Escallonia herrerae]|uniref:25S rRNA (uridine-N(3))-methyltransferase BMT5-like domain-containing protein n=1 Tax=Escallonia herrerae TaxID=1293975 RepID=A0AA89ALX3_9ASTE|nr:hypothetical protein RJ639_015751 [Escallonia herrerae]
MAKDKEVEHRTEKEGREEKWVSHYSSSHRILLVGEGDFSFSLSLALSFASASNIVATSLDSYESELVFEIDPGRISFTSKACSDPSVTSIPVSFFSFENVFPIDVAFSWFLFHCGLMKSAA